MRIGRLRLQSLMRSGTVGNAAGAYLSLGIGPTRTKFQSKPLISLTCPELRSGDGNFAGFCTFHCLRDR
jgi:hypothetical protein